MGGFLNSLGFPTDDAFSYFDLHLQLFECGQSIRTSAGIYFLWEPGEGVEIWSKLRPNEEVSYLRPFFSGSARMQVALVETKMYEEGKNILADGFFIAYPKPQKGVGFVSEHKTLQYGDGTYSSYLPFLFDVPDYDRYAGVELPALLDVQLTAFPLTMRAYETEDDWVDEQIEWDTSGEEDPYVWSGETFVPDLTLFQRETPEQYPKPTAFLAGTVLETAIITNPVTGVDFSWAKLRTAAGEIDMVASAKELDGYLVTDGVAAGNFYLAGHLLDYDLPSD